MKPDWNYRLVNYFLHHKQLTAMLFALVVLLGSFYFFRFRVEGFPQVEIPLAVVNTVVPGAGPETVDQAVTLPLVSKLEGLKGVKQISSTSQSNVSTLLVQLEEGKSAETLSELRGKVAEAELPPNAESPQVFVPEIGTAPFFVAVTGNSALVELEAASHVLVEELSEISQVSSVKRFQGPEPKIYIDIPPQLVGANLAEQIKSATLAFPLGSIQSSTETVTVSASKLAATVDELKALLVFLPGQQSPVKLGEVASVYTALDRAGQVHRVGYASEDGKVFRQQNGIIYGVTLDPNADLLKSEETVLAAIARADEKTDASFIVVYNQAKESRQQVNELVEGVVGGKWKGAPTGVGELGYLFGAIWLLVLVMLLFLDWRSALISVVALPLSFLITFVFLGLLDIQLNTIVLFSLIVVLGLIVDPAIVVLESVHRYMELGEKGSGAVLRSVSVIGAGLFMSVLTSLIVFAPFAVVSGTFGAIIKYIPLTVVPALLASYFVPMIFLTWLAGRFLKPKHVVSAGNEDTTENLWRVARWFVSANRYILARWWLSMVVVFLGVLVPIVVSGALFASGKVKQVQFASTEDTQFIQVTVPVDPGLTEQGLAAETTKLEHILGRYAKYLSHYAAMDFTGQGQGGNIAMLLELRAPAERDLKSTELSAKLTADLRAEFGAKANAADLGAGPPSSAYPVSVKVFASNSETLSRASQQIAEHLQQDSRVTDVIYDTQTSQTSTELELKQDLVAAKGLSPAVVLGQVAAQLSERTVTTLGDTKLVLRVPKTLLPQAPTELGNLFVTGPQGLVQLSEIATVVESNQPAQIKRLGGERYVEISARVADVKDAIATQRDTIAWGKTERETLGLTETAFDERPGVEDFEQSFQELFLAIALSILITYLVFVLFFKSFLQPFIILFAVPLMFIGVFPGLVAFARGQFGFLEIIGIIMVIGIVENVGIFLIDYANRKVGEGMDKREAIAISSGIRFRPIVLTKLTALAGLLPLAVFAPFWRGLAVVVIAGIVSSGILSLFTTPVLYVWLTRRRKPVMGE